MGNHSIARTAVGILGLCFIFIPMALISGNVISFGLFLSPAPTFYGIIKKKAVEEFKPDPYLATIMNCAFWVLYGMPFVHPNNTLVYTINGIGVVIETIYLTIFYIYSTTKGRRKLVFIFAIEAIFFAAIVLITMLALHGTTKRSLVVGVISDVFNVIMYIAPLTVMAKVIKTKSVKYMPFWLSLANLLNGLTWTTYALLHPFDIYILICNSIGVVSGIVQLILYACYCFNKGENNEDGDVEMKPSGVHKIRYNGRTAVA